MQEKRTVSQRKLRFPTQLAMQPRWSVFILTASLIWDSGRYVVLLLSNGALPKYLNYSLSLFFAPSFPLVLMSNFGSY